MGYLDNVVKESINTDEFLQSSIENHKRRLLTSIDELEKRIIGSVKEFKTSDGILLGPKVNLKLAQQTQVQLAQQIKQTYGAEARKVTRDYAKNATFIKRSWNNLGVSVNFTKVDKDIISTLQNSAFGNFNQFGLQGQEALVDSMYSSILARRPFAEMVTDMQGVLKGFKDKRGKSMARYAELYANDGLMNFHTELAIKKAQDAGLNNFLYYGNLMTTSRDFCRLRAGNVYSEKEITAWNTLSWNGKSGPPITNRGGYNCRHSWVPVRKKDVDEDELEQKFADEGRPLKERQERKAELLRGAPYSLKQLGQFDIRDLKQLGSGLGVDTFGRPKQEIFDAIINAQKKVKPGRVLPPLKRGKGRPKKVAPVVKRGKGRPPKGTVLPKRGKGRPPKEIVPITETDKLAAELKAAEKELKEYVAKGAPGSGLKRWTVAGNNYAETAGVEYAKAYRLHEVAFEKKLTWYKSLPTETKLIERQKTLDSILNRSRSTIHNVIHVKQQQTILNATQHMSYRLISDLERSEFKIVWDSAKRGRAYWADGKIYLFKTGEISKVMAHEIAHGVDAMMANGARGGYGRTGFVWKNHGRYVGQKDRNKVRKAFKRQTTGEMGVYRNGDGLYFKGNWIDNYEGRKYDRPSQFVKDAFFGDTGIFAEGTPVIGQQFWSMNSQRYNTMVREATRDFRSDLRNIERAIASKLEDVTLAESKMARDLFTKEVNVLKGRQTTLLKKDVVGYLEDYKQTNYDWNRAKRMYPEFTKYIEDFYTTITAT